MFVSCRSANSTAESLIFFVEKEQPLFILNAPSKLCIPSFLLPGQSITPCVSLSAKINHRLAEASTKRPSSALNSLKLHSFLILSTDPTAYAVRQLGSSILLLGAVPGQMNLPNPTLHWDSEAYSDKNLSYLRITPLTVGVTVAFSLFVGKGVTDISCPSSLLSMNGNTNVVDSSVPFSTDTKESTSLRLVSSLISVTKDRPVKLDSPYSLILLISSIVTILGTMLFASRSFLNFSSVAISSRKVIEPKSASHSSIIFSSFILSSRSSHALPASLVSLLISFRFSTMLACSEFNSSFTLISNFFTFSSSSKMSASVASPKA